jgi:predicted nucleotide-binding protein
MTIDEKIALLTEFHASILKWFHGTSVEQGRDSLRSLINRKSSLAASLVKEAGCLQLMNIGPPPAIGGLVAHNVNPFDMLFESLWGMSLIPAAADMCEQAIGVFEHRKQRMSHEDILTELRALFLSRNGMSTEEGNAWLARVLALVALVDGERASSMKHRSEVFSVPVSIQARESAWKAILQDMQETIAKLETGGYTPPSTNSRTSHGNKRVFIGHGHSSEWLKLKDFLTTRLQLQYEEFNRESAAGYSTKERLEQMLETSSFALLVMTGEDNRIDGSSHARDNVVHEVGLFQGRYGFSRAIVLLEEGCAEFSNIQGLVQIRFPQGNILAASEDIRRVLERESLIT